MKVIKFGGSSMSEAAASGAIGRIIAEGAASCGCAVVVVGAMSNSAERLLAAARLALEGGQWLEAFNALRSEHEQLLGCMVKGERERTVSASLGVLFDELHSLLRGVSLVKDLSLKTVSAIVGYGSLLSSQMVYALVEGAAWRDSREFIKTTYRDGKAVYDAASSEERIRESLGGLKGITVVPGYIAQDSATGEATTLGRGGTDYTAAILAGALGAEELDLWTDVDGFTTADPHVIASAYTINALSYVEAMELCHFGANVLYPPTIYPVCVKNIPIRVRNMLKVEAPGSLISAEVEDDGKAIRGISSIKNTSLVHVSGLSMVGVIGVNERIFAALTRSGISVFFVAQASSESSTSIGVRSEDSDKAAEVLDEEFGKEISTGAMHPMQVETGLATVAIVGDKMRSISGVAAKLFGTLGRSGISVIAMAQGAAGTNISFVVAERFLRKSLNVLHDSFFLSEYNVLNVFVCGVGTVGGKLLEQLREQQESLKEQRRLLINVVGIASSSRALFSRDGLDLENYQKALAEGEESNSESLIRNVVGMNIFNAVFVDCTASSAIAASYQELLDHNISVVAANKLAASGDYSTYAKLKATALERGVKYLFETNVGAGLPIIGTINDLRNSGDKILKIEAVLSGTLNFIFDALSSEVPFSQAVRLAVEKGFAEPDPRIDLSGKDVVRKIVILAREAGYAVEQSDVGVQLFVPEELLAGSEETFWENLPSLDRAFEEQRREGEAQGKKWRFVATMERGATTVGLRAVEQGQPFYNLEGSNNIVLLTTERYKEHPMVIQGYGAGASVTAAGVFANIMSIANI